MKVKLKTRLSNVYRGIESTGMNNSIKELDFLEQINMLVK